MTIVNGSIPALSGNERIWIFQSNLPHFSIAKTVDGMEIGQVGAWYVQDHLDELRGGDLVLMWEEGENPGLYALGTLAGVPYEGDALEAGGPKAQWIRWRLDATLTPPVSKKDLQAHDLLKGLAHFDRKDATNIPIDRKQWEAVRSMLQADPKVDLAIE